MIFIILPLLFVPLVYGLSSTPDACALKKFRTPTLCTNNGVPTSGPDADQCCYFQETIDDNGKSLGTEQFCADCHNEGGQLVCGDFDLQYRLPPGALQNLPTPEQVPPTPLFGRDIPQDLQTLEETPPTPLPTPPTSPTVSPENGENVVGENRDQGDVTPTPQGGGVRPPLGQNFPELVEEPEQQEPSDEGQEDSSEGAETAGPLT